MKKVIIEGMSCMHCVAHVKEALEELNGVSDVKVDLDSKTATFNGDVSNEDVKNAIEEVGYDVISIEG